MEPTANQISTPKAPANHKATSKYQLEIQSESAESGLYKRFQIMDDFDWEKKSVNNSKVHIAVSWHG